MKAVVLHEYGGPEKLTWEDHVPEPQISGNTVLVATTAASVNPPSNSPRLEYKMYLFHAGKVEVEVTLAPSLNFVPGRGLRYAISFDDQPPQVHWSSSSRPKSTVLTK